MITNPSNTMWSFIHELSSKQGITEVIVNSPDKVFVERDGRFIQLNVKLKKKDILEFARDVANFNQRSFDQDHPILDGTLADGSRVNVINEPFAKGSPAVTIRKYLKEITSFDDRPAIFGLNEQWIQLLQAFVSSRCNVIISGGTGVGKTTLLNLLLKEVVPSQRIICVEDTAELSLALPNTVRLECFDKVTIRDLIKNALRMRPDRIIVGEVRGAEFFDLLQSMNTGHDGSMSSLHASSSSECLSRMENLYMMAGFDVPIQVVRKQIAYGVDFIVQLGRDREGKRVVTEVMEVTGMEGANILSHKLALREDHDLVATGITPKMMERLHREGGLPMDFFQAMEN